MNNSSSRSMMVVSMVFTAGIMSGCSIKLAPTTQHEMASLATQREFAIAYARAAKTPGVVKDDVQRVLAAKYGEAATKANLFVNTFDLQVNQTQAGQTLDASRIDAPAHDAATSLEQFVTKAKSEIDVPRTEDFGATAVAIGVAVKAATDIAKEVAAWWQEETDRQRKAWTDYSGKLKMQIWPELQPLKTQ